MSQTIEHARVGSVCGQTSLDFASVGKDKPRPRFNETTKSERKINMGLEFL